MVLKFLTAGVISAVLAGGAMYLAMDEETLAKLRAGPEAAQSVPIKPELRSGGSAQDIGVVDRLLGRDQPNAPGQDPTAPEAPDPLNSRIGQPVEDGTPARKKGWLEDYLPRRDTVPTPRVTVRSPDQPPPVDPAVFDTLIDQAGRLEITDARDDAFLNILNFSLAEQRYDVADGMVERLSSPELRDTARQRIGISHATAGRMDEAFAVLDTVEIKELSDPIRLEIIRSVTATRQPGQ